MMKPGSAYGQDMHDFSASCPTDADASSPIRPARTERSIITYDDDETQWSLPAIRENSDKKSKTKQQADFFPETQLSDLPTDNSDASVMPKPYQESRPPVCLPCSKSQVTSSVISCNCIKGHIIVGQ